MPTLPDDNIVIGVEFTVVPSLDLNLKSITLVSTELESTDRLNLCVPEVSSCLWYIIAVLSSTSKFNVSPLLLPKLNLGFSVADISNILTGLVKYPPFDFSNPLTSNLYATLVPLFHYQ
jgi:hypothetical protein